jgi:hypothetical protein
VRARVELAPPCRLASGELVEEAKAKADRARSKPLGRTLATEISTEIPAGIATEMKMIAREIVAGLAGVGRGKREACGGRDSNAKPSGTR